MTLIFNENLAGYPKKLHSLCNMELKLH